MKQFAGERCGKRNAANGGDHAKRHGCRHRESRCEQTARERVAHDEGGERAGDHARHESERPAVAFMHMMVVPYRAPEQVGANEGNQRARLRPRIEVCARPGQRPC